jgi:hypothetical protein
VNNCSIEDESQLAEVRNLASAHFYKSKRINILKSEDELGVYKSLLEETAKTKLLVDVVDASCLDSAYTKKITNILNACDSFMQDRVGMLEYDQSQVYFITKTVALRMASNAVVEGLVATFDKDLAREFYNIEKHGGGNVDQQKYNVSLEAHNKLLVFAIHSTALLSVRARTIEADPELFNIIKKYMP